MTGEGNMELTNEQRKYFGLELVDPSWDRVEIPKASGYNTIHPEMLKTDLKNVLYFDGEILRKEIAQHENGGFRENSYNLRTQDNRTKIAPITAKGKPKILNSVNIQRCKPYGVYMDLNLDDQKLADVLIGNYDTQKTYYSSHFTGTKLKVDEFFDKWFSETTEQDFKDLEVFKTEKRRHCKFKEGDFFRFKYDRRHYGYGRVLMDVEKWVKDGNQFWDVLMGKAVCISIYHIVTEDPDVGIDELSKLKFCPSEYIMDNHFFYGEYEVIGNAPLPDDIDYPVMYGRSISGTNPNKIISCIGKTYREIPLEGNENPGRTYLNNGIGFGPHIDMPLIEECIKTGSNDPFWKKNADDGWSKDIRAPQFIDDLIKMKKQMGIN